MTRELLTALFQDNIFQWGVEFGALIGFAGGVTFMLISFFTIKDYKKFKQNN